MRTLHTIALVCVALLAGLTLAHVLQSPGSRGLDGAEWLAVQHTFYGGFAVVGAVCEILGLVAAAVIGVVRLRRREPRLAWAPFAAAAAVAGMFASYWFGNRPVNALVAVWTPDTLPPDWPAYRASWEAAHAVSAVLALAALAALVVAVVWQRPSGIPSAPPPPSPSTPSEIR